MTAGPPTPRWSEVAFSSDRGGFPNIWICESDGSNPVQLTNSSLSRARPLVPDGRRLAFDSVEKGHWNLYAIDAEAECPAADARPSGGNDPAWSRDGQWIYFDSDRAGSRQIWKMRAEGGPEIQLTQGGGCRPQESGTADSSITPRTSGRPPSGECQRTADRKPGCCRRPSVHHDWTLARSGIYFSKSRPPDRRQQWTIQFLDLESGRVTNVARRMDHSTTTL